MDEGDEVDGGYKNIHRTLLGGKRGKAFLALGNAEISDSRR